MLAPISLLDENRKLLRDVYSIATLRDGLDSLEKGRDHDEITIIASEPWDERGILPNCSMSLNDGNTLKGFQWSTIETWHVGLTCQLTLREQDFIAKEDDENFNEKFHDLMRKEKIIEGGKRYRIFKLYKLPQGANIPDGVGIEQDGENHVCLYPTGEDVPISNIKVGQSSFTIIPLQQLRDLWQPYALMKLKAEGFIWPIDFPPDYDIFPFRQWLSCLILYGELENAMDAKNIVDGYLSEAVTLHDFFSKMVDMSKVFAMDCPFDYLEMNVSVTKALIDLCHPHQHAAEAKDVMISELFYIAF